MGQGAWLGYVAENPGKRMEENAQFYTELMLSRGTRSSSMGSNHLFHISTPVQRAATGGCLMNSTPGTGRDEGCFMIVFPDFYFSIKFDT